MTLAFTTLATDNFNRANENPLDPAKWTILFPAFPLQIVSNVCETVDPAFGAALYVGASLPGNQWAEIQFPTFVVPNCVAQLNIRSNAAATNALALQPTSAVAQGTRVLSIINNVVTVLGTFPIAVSGDIYRIAAIENSWYLFKNGSQIGTGTAVLPASGGVILYLSPVSASTDVTADNFSVGSVVDLNAYSVPDSRAVTDTTPNSFRAIQGTAIYDVPKVFSLRWWFDTLFNRTQPLPVDSRVVTPADSRTTPNIPQNSRTNPPF